MSKSTIDKAARLLATGQVEPEQAPARAYTVHGDTSTYRVVVGANIAICTCPSQVRCSHIEAAVGFDTASPSTRLLLEAQLRAREARDPKKGGLLEATLPRT